MAELPTILIIILVIAVLWDLFWRAVAVQHAAENDSKVWLVALLLISSFGILPIIYLMTHQDDNTGRRIQIS